MATPVVTEKWAGTLDCASCARKRLTGDQFSKKMLERHRRDNVPLRCKHCVEAAEQAERDAAATRKAAKESSNADNSVETRTCAGCGKGLAQAEFNRNQWSKGEGKSRCRSCVEAALAQETIALDAAKESKIKAAQDAVDAANASGDANAILKAESVLSSLQAEKVTGLKPVRMGRGRGRGRGRSGGGRGRS